MWQARTLLNPHFAIGTKDQYACRVFYEPLAGWDEDGNLIAQLATEIPSLKNGGVAKDRLSVTWELKKNVPWHHGQPLTADDAVFTWEHAADPATAATSIGIYKDLNGENIDPQTTKGIF